MSEIVRQALADMAIRRLQRQRDFDRHGCTWPAELRALREVMFSRREIGEAFHPLNEAELALLENQVNVSQIDKRLRVVGGNGASYDFIRHNHLAGLEPGKGVTPTEFRIASAIITNSLMKFVAQEYGTREYEIPPGTPVLLPWRAALAFGSAALHVGVQDFYHLGARRNEATLATEIYFEEIPAVLQGQAAGAVPMAIVADPMLASGNTVIAAINRLKALGVPEEKIIVVSVISAPEGVYHVLDQFPRVRIVVGNHDERLNSKGYIEPGLGDFGDLYFGACKKESVYAWQGLGILSGNAARAILARMEARS